MSAPEPPRPLGEAGRAWWDAVHREWSFDPSNEPLVVAIAESLDEIDRLKREVNRATGLMVSGSKGQLTEHPGLASLRRERTVVATLLRQLDLPDADEDTGHRLASVTPVRSSAKARESALTRWHGHRTGRGA